jgi:hypothetical protein
LSDSGAFPYKLPWVTDGTRTRDPRDHNPVLYQLSYDHHAHGKALPVVPDKHSRPPGTAVDGVTGVSDQRPAAMAFAVSTSGPGSGTNTVRR